MFKFIHTATEQVCKFDIAEAAHKFISDIEDAGSWVLHKLESVVDGVENWVEVGAGESPLPGAPVAPAAPVIVETPAAPPAPSGEVEPTSESPAQPAADAPAEASSSAGGAAPEAEA